jgi:hypothetical protein
MFSDLFWALYLIDVVGNFSTGLGLWVAAVGLVFAATAIHDDTCFHEGKWGYKKPLWLVMPITTLVIIIGCLLPSKGTMYMMLGVKTTENVVESPLGKKLQEIINAEVDGYLKNIKEK